MVKSLLINGPRSISFQESEEKELLPNQVRIRTLYSGISHGTEINVYRGLAPMFKKKQDPATRLFLETNEPEWKYPIRYGYANVGEVVELGSHVTKLQRGDIVFTGNSHETNHIHDEGGPMKLPQGLESRLGIFTANMTTAYNGILDARINLGETVAVFGQGVIGQLIAQMAKLSGAVQVVVVDVIKKRLELAKELGADVALNPKEVKDIALEIRRLTDNRGADVAIDVSGSDKALNEAVRTVGYNGRVIALSWYPGPISNVSFDGEFHHNRIQIICSQVGGIAPELAPRWDGGRRGQVVRDILLQRLKTRELITNVFAFDDAARAYEIIDKHPEEVIQVILKY